MLELISRSSDLKLPSVSVADLDIHGSGYASSLVGFQIFNIPARPIKPVGRVFDARKGEMS